MYLYKLSHPQKRNYHLCPGHVEMYTRTAPRCSRTHISNLRSFIMEDVLEATCDMPAMM